VEFTPVFPQVRGRAVRQYEIGAADFPDDMIGELNDASGCDATLTFDREAAKNLGFRLLPP
jgi:predicted nucleic-acid-binding protein